MSNLTQKSGIMTLSIWVNEEMIISVTIFIIAIYKSNLTQKHFNLSKVWFADIIPMTKKREVCATI
jgi:hypothetical protein